MGDAGLCSTVGGGGGDVGLCSSEERGGAERGDAALCRATEWGGSPRNTWQRSMTGTWTGRFSSRPPPGTLPMHAARGRVGKWFVYLLGAPTIGGYWL